MANRNAWIAAVIVIIVIVSAVLAYYFIIIQSSPTATVTVTLCEGELSGGTKYGFGFSASTLQSPGPTRAFKVGDVVNMTVYTVETLPHEWEMTDLQNTSGHVLFNVQIGATTPLSPGTSGSVIQERKSDPHTIAFVSLKLCSPDFPLNATFLSRFGRSER